MKKYFFSITGIILFSTIHLFASSTKITEVEIIKLVDQAVELIEKKGDMAIKTIGDPKGPFFVQSKSLYVFVYDENCVIKAHPYKPTLVGRSYLGKPDVRGKKFRDEIVQKALKEGKGWTEYSYQKPGEAGIFKKKVFGKRAIFGKRKFIVCAGMYID